MSSVALTSFFMASVLFNDVRQTAGDVGDGVVEQAIAPRVAEVGHGQHELARTRGFFAELVSPGVRLCVCGKEIAAVGGGEVTDFDA